MKNKNRITNHHYILAFFAALRENFSSKSLFLCAKFFRIVLFMVIALAFASCPYELSRFPVLPGDVRITPGTEVPVNTQVTVEYIPKYSGTYTEQVSYQWSQNGIDIPGETSTVFTPVEPGTYTVTMSAYFYESIERVITATNEAGSMNGALSGELRIMYASDTSVGEELVVVYSSSEKVSFQWSKNGVPIAGAILATYIPLEPGIYTVTISAIGYESITSDPVTVNPKNAVPGSIRISPDANVGTGTLLTATYIGSETVSYQWSRNGEIIPGATSFAYTPAIGGVYTVTVDATGYNGKTSNAVVVIEKPALHALNFLVSDITKSYNGTPQGASVYFFGQNIDVSTAGVMLVYYSGKDGTDYAESTSAPINAGVYDILVCTTGGTVYEPFGKATVGVLTIGKAAGELVNTPTMGSKMHDSIEINAITASTGQDVQYGINETNDASGARWQNTRTFIGLDPTTIYYIFTRSIANNNYQQGIPSEGVQIITAGSLGGDVVTSQFGISLAWIPSGTFWMGSPTSEHGRFDNEILHQVTLTNGYYMGVYQITQEQYSKVMGENPSNFFTGPSNSEIQSKRPVEWISWYDAVEFCNALSILEGLTPYYSIDKNNKDSKNTSPWDALKWSVSINSAANGYRLPTEAQWEYACRAGTATDFNKSVPSNWEDLAVTNLGWFDVNSSSMTHEVGKKAPNDWGLYDMHGNLWDWCWDWYGNYQDWAITDPVGTASGTYRVRRGGSWLSTAQYARSACRDGVNPSDLAYSIGIRVVRP